MNVDADINGILSLMRTHIEIRNRSWMKRVHRDCFIGSDAVDFLVQQGFADTRPQAVEIGQEMVKRKLIRHVTSKSKKFQDSYYYYRFAEDDLETSVLATSNAGNGIGTTLGLGGCKFSFCPHTAHNSFILDVALAEEVERAVAGASIEARSVAVSKLRARVREVVEPSAPDWMLVQSTEVNHTHIHVYQRKRPRGDFKNVKMTGFVGESPKGFVRSILSFEKRKQWESMFEDGVIVEAINIGETSSAVFQDDTDEDLTIPSPSSPPPTPPTPSNIGGTSPPPPPSSQQVSSSPSVGVPVVDGPSNPPSTFMNPNPPRSLARKTDDVLTFLETVDLAGIPKNMPIAFLNDPERQHALAHLRKQMMLANPQECMLCQLPFASPADLRFCPCCAMVSCGRCMSRRVFEVVSRQVVSICIHCFRESSRIRHPPQAVQDTQKVHASVVGKWWRPEDLGIIDYSQSHFRTHNNSEMNSQYSTSSSASSSKSNPSLNSACSPDSSTTAFIETAAAGAVEAAELPLVPGLNDGDEASPMTPDSPSKNLTSKMWKVFRGLGGNANEENEENAGDGEGDGIGQGVNEAEFVKRAEEAQKAAMAAANGGKNAAALPSEKTARCKNCGALISRDVEVIEEHMLECPGLRGGHSTNMGNDGSNADNQGTAGVGGSVMVFDGQGLATLSNPKFLAGLPRRPDLDKALPRIIYRTARPASKMYAPREVCAFQDAFVDSAGVCYVYEVSVRHCDVRGLPGYVTADVMLLVHAAFPLGPSGTANAANGSCGSQITIVSQIDTRVKGPQWMLSFMTTAEEGGGGGLGNDIGTLRRDDLIRELRACGDLVNMLPNAQSAHGKGNHTTTAGGSGKKKEDEMEGEEGSVSLDDFDLLAVLGRGGFGKVMQVRHRTTGEVYAMKILKKTELRRRRQVERTQTERTILAAVRHPFIVCLHFAFQNAQKLYMVMDFVQGGDFFTLMRKFKRLPEDWVKLYVAQIGMALQHLHDMDIVYRDLKPENILLDSNGNLKLTDFGLSRFFETRPPAAEDMIGEDDVVTRSFCGTEQYMSPEMLLQQGHNYRMDWWCLGLLMHEMVSARHPFQGPSHYDTLRNMVTKQPNIDSRLSPPAAVLVRGLLVKNPKSRLGCKEGLQDLKVSAFFSGLDWEALYDRRIEMPYKPDLKSAMDISSFETTFTQEAPVDSVATSGKKGNGDGDKDSKKKGGGGIIRGLFGLGSTPTAPKEEKQEVDVFKGFSFTKDDAMASSPKESSSNP